MERVLVLPSKTKKKTQSHNEANIMLLECVPEHRQRRMKVGFEKALKKTKLKILLE